MTSTALDAAAEADINRWAAIAANVFICTLPAIVIVMLPLLVGGLVISMGMTEQQGGFVVAVDMAGYTLGTIASFFFIGKVNWRRAALLSLLVMALANLACGWIVGLNGLMALRFISGAGGGIVTAITFAAMGQTRDPDAAYGLWLVFQAIFGGIGSITFSGVIDNWGLGGGFIIFAVLLLLGCAVVGFVPTQALKGAAGQNGLTRDKWPKVGLGIVAIMAVYIALMSVYAYLERIGAASNLSLEQIGQCFLVMTVAGLLGGLSASHFGSRFGRVLPTLIATVGIILSFGLLSGDHLSFYLYMFICALYFGMWSFLLPYLVGAVAAIDASGRALSLGNAALGGGLTLGPFIAALLVDGHYQGLIYFGIAVLIIGIVLVMPLLLLSQQD